MEGIYNQLLLAVLTAIIGIIAYLLRGLIQVGITYLKAKLGDTQFKMLKAFVETVVRFLEQSPAFKDLTGEEKKERAIILVTKWCDDNKIPVTHDIIDKVIEEIVNLVKQPMLDVAEPLVIDGEVVGS